MNRYTEQLDKLDELEGEGENVDWEEEYKELEKMLDYRTVFINPIIKCNTFMEEER